MTINQSGWALMSTRALIKTLVEPGLSSALPGANRDRLSKRTGSGTTAGVWKTLVRRFTPSLPGFASQVVHTTPAAKVIVAAAANSQGTT
ncbi:hypothetical protein D3C76_1165010 [compost metagenome]